MKNIYLKLALTTLLSTIAVQGFSKQEEPNLSSATGQPPFFEYHNRIILFSPLHLGYERIKPKDLYWGIEGWAVPLKNSQSNLFMDIEGRMGYNFFYNGRDHFTPFAGVGYLQDFSKKEYHRPGVTYGTIGFLYDHEFNSVFNMGFNVKSLIGGAVSHDRLNWGSPVLGVDIALPLTLRFGHNRHWDYRIEPFNTYIHGTEAYFNCLGCRNSIAYRF